MPMYDALKSFAEQFAFEPKIEHADRLKKTYECYIVAGMGGSHLAADILHTYDPSLPLIIHNDYGLPALPKRVLKKCLVIASSYSGDTEEALDALRCATELGIDRAAITIGGKLLPIAEEQGIP
jgi:glucose/mannose-6-phosphate isomerase